MNKVATKKRYGVKTIMLVGLSVLLTACGQSSSGVEKVDLFPLDDTSSGSGNVNLELWGFINAMPYEQISDAELAALDFMREEEKLARDVYLGMFDIWGTQIFANIAASEQTHTDAVLLLIQKYDLSDPAQDKLRGEFSDPTLQGLYDSLVAQGTASLIDALIVGATIEDLDIFDLHRQLALVDNQDITAVFENLLMGSRNHLRAFFRRLDDMNIVYTPVYISQQQYDEIVNTPMERGQ
jgi:hypothetical protein